MRIALVSEHASPLAGGSDTDAGGQHGYVDCLSRHLAASGHSVTVYTRRDAERLPFRVVTAGGVEVVHVAAGPPEPIDHHDLYPYMREFGARLLSQLRASRPDVLHSHFWMSGSASRPAVETLGLPWVHTFHALGSVRRRHQQFDDRSSAHRQEVERGILCDADAVVASCTDEVRELRQMGARGQHIDVVPYGFDAERFRPAPREPDGEVRIAAVSRLLPREGVADVISAMRCVPRARLLVVGGVRGGAEMSAHEQYLHALVERSGLDDRVQFLGGLPPAMVPSVLHACDFSVAAPWYEPYGLAPVEAMGCGLPVVATAVGGLLDTVVDGVNGLLVPPRDVMALSEAMSLLAESSRLRGRLGRRASERAHRLYSWDVIARRVESVYLAAARHRQSVVGVSA